MKKKPGRKATTAGLRHRAEARLAKRRPAPAPPSDDTDARRLLHELQVHQIELELQNEELFRSRVEVEVALERYTELFDYAPIGYVLLDIHGMVREINHAGAGILGHDRAAFVRQRFAAQIDPRDRAQLSAMIAEAIAGDTAVIRRLRTMTKVLALRAFALRRGELKVLLSFADVTAEHDRAVALEQSERALREADRRKDAFLGMLSHELRNPLTPLRNGLALLAGSGSDQATRTLSIMERQLDQLTRLIDDLLDITRITRGKIEIRRANVDLGELVLHVIEDQRAGFDAVGIALEHEIQSGVASLDADEARITQVITNLLHNAQKFTERGGRVTVAVRARPPGVELVMRDTGIGISPDLIEHVFEPFVQAPQTTARSRGGLGLGLAMVKAIVELHGGSTRIESAGAGRGTAVTLWFPHVKSEGSRPRVREPSAARSRRVLVIEDSIDTADSLRLALALAGHEVRVAHDGPTGLALAKAFHPDIVLCDIGLPGMDGYAVARALRADDELHHTYIAAVTGYARPDDMKQAKEAGFDQHVAKPVSRDTLERLLGHLRESPPNA